MARIHHLGCATMCPVGKRFLAGEGGLLARAEMVAHVLLVETSDALVLVDTGFGTGDVADPKRLGQPFRALIQPRLRSEQTAIAQIRALGLDPADVRHILVTHLDLDHAGGLPDFPGAEVHCFRPEIEAALSPSLRERARYIPGHLAHGPRWTAHDVAGEQWLGFEAVRAIDGLDPEILIVPVLGHSRGHSAVAVRDGERWLLHCGDAYFHRRALERPPRTPIGLRAFESVVNYDRKTRLQNAERLRELVAGHGDEVSAFCAHDPVELERAQAGSTPGG